MFWKLRVRAQLGDTFDQTISHHIVRIGDFDEIAAGPLHEFSHGVRFQHDGVAIFFHQRNFTHATSPFFA